MDLSEALKFFRNENGLYQKEIAARLGITRAHYALIEESHKFLSFRLVKKISIVLKTTVIYVLRPV